MKTGKTMRDKIDPILFFLNPFRSESKNIFNIIAKGNVDKEKRILIMTLKIFCVIFIATIVLAVLTLTLILPGIGFASPNNDPYYLSIAVVGLYIFSAIMLVLGHNWLRIIKHINLFGSSPFGLFMNLVTRLTIYEMLVFSGFFIGVLGVSWLAIVPLLLIALIFFVLTYPTEKRWEMWLEIFK